MKKYVFCMVLLLSVSAGAGELENAKELFDRKSYAQALQLYTRLGNAGNAEAQLRVGEMHLYGEAGAVDVAKAETWFRKSAAKGNKTAIAALEMIRNRALRKTDIAYWMSGYDGADLTAPPYRCPIPRIPAMSKYNDEIAAVAARVHAWQECYNGFVANINAAAPLTRKIPKDIADLMTKDEMEAATRHLDGVHTSIVEHARVASKLLLADYAVWRDATDAYVGQHNQIVKDTEANKRKD